MSAHLYHICVALPGEDASASRPPCPACITGVDPVTDLEYGVGYEGHVVRDESWACVADVIASYHGSGYVTPDGRVTGKLLRRVRGDSAWDVIA